MSSRWVNVGGTAKRLDCTTAGLTEMGWLSLYEVEHATIQAVGDGGTIPNTWPDSMGVHDLTNVGTITRTLDLVDADFNNHSSISFNAGAGHWRKASLSIAQPFSIVYLFFNTSQDISNTIFGLNTTASTYGVGQGSTGSGRVLRSHMGTSVELEPVPTANNLWLVEAYFNGESSYALINGVCLWNGTSVSYGASVEASYNPGTNSIDQFVLGAGYTGSAIGSACNSKLSFVGVYEGDHRNDPAWMPTARYIAEHWNVKCSYNPNYP